MDEESAGKNPAKKRRSHRRSQYEFKSVDDITEDDLENVASRSKDKIWDKDNVSHQHLDGFSAGAAQLVLFCSPCISGAK